MKPERPEYVVVLRPEPWVKEPVLALRRALKTLLRRFELCCTDLQEQPHEHD
jgi:hypothetical protein